MSDVVVENDQVQEELPLLTFNALYNILREEKKNKGLQKYPPLFYEALEQFLVSKKQQVKSEKDPVKLKKEENILKNSIKIAEDIVSIRAQKISKIAISNTVSPGILEETNILEAEISLFEQTISQTKKLLKKIT